MRRLRLKTKRMAIPSFVRYREFSDSPIKVKFRMIVRFRFHHRSSSLPEKNTVTKMLLKPGILKFPFHIQLIKAYSVFTGDVRKVIRFLPRGVRWGRGLVTHHLFANLRVKQTVSGKNLDWLVKHNYIVFVCEKGCNPLSPLVHLKPW